LPSSLAASRRKRKAGNSGQIRDGSPLKRRLIGIHGRGEGFLETRTKLDFPSEDVGGLPIGDDHYLAENLNEYQSVFLDPREILLFWIELMVVDYE
jgi:hypothetical protein